VEKKLDMNEDITIKKVVQDGLCTGCGTCVGLCPQDAIEMVIDRKKGIYVPVIDENKCNDCGICGKVCPGRVVDFPTLNEQVFGKQPEDILLGNYLNCYTGYSVDNDIRYNSSSGGMVTALLIFALDEGIIDGALVSKMSKDNPLEPQPFIARTKEEIIEAARSKYCPVPANIAIKEILRKEGKYAVVGLPCHMHGIRKAEAINNKLKERIVLHLGIFCSNSNNFSMTDYVLWRYKIKKDNVSRIDYRGDGWPGHMTICINKYDNKIINYKDYILFHEFGMFTPKRCTLCYDTTGEFTDISFGDAWGVSESNQDNIGLSIMIARNILGEEFLKKGALNNYIYTVQTLPKFAYAGNKRANLKARMHLNRLVLNKLPVYLQKLPKPRLTAYPYYFLLYFNMYVSSKHHLRWLIYPLAKFEKIFIRR
jgi:coenzyme F420 hydrogenase subunit beta